MSDPSVQGPDKDEAALAGEDKPKPPAKKRSKTPLIVLAVVVVVLVVAGIAYAASTHNLVSTDDAQVDGNAVTLQAKVSGYVTELDVTDNQRVKAGQLLFRIDPRDYVVSRDQARAQLAQMQAQAQNDRVNLEMTRISAPAKLAQAKAEVASAGATRDYASSDLGRQTSVEARSTTQQSIDQARENLGTAQASLANNKAQVNISGLVPQTIDQAKAQLDKSLAQVQQAQGRARHRRAEPRLYRGARAPGRLGDPAQHPARQLCRRRPVGLLPGGAGGLGHRQLQGEPA